MINFNCPSCGKAYQLPQSVAGKTVPCIDCRTAMEIPSTGQSSVKTGSQGSVSSRPHPFPGLPVAARTGKQSARVYIVVSLLAVGAIALFAVGFTAGRSQSVVVVDRMDDGIDYNESTPDNSTEGGGNTPIEPVVDPTNNAGSSETPSGGDDVSPAQTEAEKTAAENRAADKEAADKEAADKEAADKRAVDKKAADKEAADKKAAKKDADRDELEKTIAYYTKAIQLDPNYAGNYINRAYAYAIKGESDLASNDLAIKDCTDALRLNPDKAVAVWAFINRSYAYANKGEINVANNDLAIKDCTEALRLNPNDRAKRVAYLNRGCSYAEKGRIDPASNYLAINDCTESLYLKADDEVSADAYVHRGLANLNLGNFDKAIADCSEAIRLNPDFGIAYFTRGGAYEKKDDNTKAEADFGEAKRLGYEPSPRAADVP